MRSLTGAISLSMLACSRDAPVESTRVNVAMTDSAPSAPPAPSVARRCLPVVAASCGCVYSCGTGVEVSPGKWRVSHPVWGTNPINATIAPWCVRGACTDAFHGEIVCSVVCPPRPADPTCHFEGDTCTSGQRALP